MEKQELSKKEALSEELVKEYGFKKEIVEEMNEEQLHETLAVISINVQQTRNKAVEEFIKGNENIEEATKNHAISEIKKRREFENKYKSLKNFVKSETSALAAKVLKL